MNEKEDTKMEEKHHTPGPWHIKTAMSGNIFIYDNEARNSEDRIAGVDGVHRGKDNAYANANLIAAAPDLLEACKAFLRAPGVGGRGHGSISIEVQTYNLDAARAAIAKAKGGA